MSVWKRWTHLVRYEKERAVLWASDIRLVKV